MVQFEADAPNVAVIAIHGVGQHLSGASAEAVSTLLLSIGRDSSGIGGGTSDNEPRNESQEKPAKPAPPYSGFVTTSIDVPLRPVQSPAEDAKVANDRKQSSLLSSVWGMFNERRGYLAATRYNSEYVPLGYTQRELRPGEPDRGEYGYQFMLTQVAGYQGEVDRSFQTVRLEGKRAANSPAATVHLYDAHYSDLTKPQSSILSFFFAFYQLLFHLASLSLQAVYWAEAENVQADKKRIWRWRIGSSVHAASVRLLIMWIPFLNLILLEIASSAFADKVQSWSLLPVLSIGFAAVLSLGVTFWLLRQKGSPSRPFLWAAVPFLGTGLGVVVLGGVACLYKQVCHLEIPFFETLLLVTWLLAAGLILAWIAWKYDPLRPGAFKLSIALYVVNLFWFLFYLLPNAAGHDQVATASLWAVQWMFGELLLSWIFCLLSALLHWPLSVFCIHGIKKDSARKARAKAAFRTGRFAFAVPAILFVIVTCALWSGVVVYGSGKLKAYDRVSPTVMHLGLFTWPADRTTDQPAYQKVFSFIVPTANSVTQWVSKIGPPETPPDCECPAHATPPNTAYWSRYLTGLLLASVTPGLLVTMAIFALSLLLLAWAVLPSVIFEVKPEWTENANSTRIRSLGEWVSRGLDNTAILTRLLWFAIVPVPLVFFALDGLVLSGIQLEHWEHIVNYAGHLTLPLIKWEGLILAVSGAAVFGYILKSLTTVLDTILDVDNYLRTSPIDQTPRALIAERCTSLLRYIAAYRDDQNRPYSKVIIVAHSLGSMVTTDLLRYLERSAGDSPDLGLARYGFRKCAIPTGQSKLPICVFSMGSPLRQLLNRFFPHLYWWVADVPDNSLAAVGAPVAPPIPRMEIPPALPRPDEMNATAWSNAYRSGDYVGRSLWVGQWLIRNATGNTAQPPDVAEVSTPPACTEMCIGLGAHTHYWDRSAPDIAARLDQLITTP
jgi:hypothetical protein